MKRQFYPLYRRMNPVESPKGAAWPRREMHEFAKAIVVGNLAFLSGVSVEPGEAPSGDALEQVEVIVKKLNSTLQDIGLSLGNLVKHTIYVKQGEDGHAISNKFHDECYRYAPILRDEPDAGTLVYVYGLGLEGMKVEVDAMAAYTE